jgi:hypothetical protein
VRFIAFETLTTGVLARECAFNSRTSSFVHGFKTRRATLFAIFSTLQLEAVHIMSNFRTSSEVALTVLTSSYNWTRAFPLVEDEMHPIIPEQAEAFARLESPCRASRQSAPCPPPIRGRRSLHPHGEPLSFGASLTRASSHDLPVFRNTTTRPTPRRNYLVSSFERIDPIGRSSMRRIRTGLEPT